MKKSAMFHDQPIHLAAEEFNPLTSAELIVLEEHLKLGMGHLRRFLTKKEIKQLFSLHVSTHKQALELESDKAEIGGNLALFLNTIFTATFGAWMGFSGFWELELSSFRTFLFIVCFAASVGGFLGYQNVRFTKQQAQGVIQGAYLRFLQLSVLNKIREKREEEMEALNTQLTELFMELAQQTSYVGKEKQFILDYNNCSTEEVSELTQNIKSLLKEKGIFHSSTHEASHLIHLLNSYYGKEKDLENIHPLKKGGQKSLPSYIKKLITISSKEVPSSLSWLQTNIRNLSIGLTPTLLGGFSSLFVYLGGAPRILKEFGYEKLYGFFSMQKVKFFEFTICIFVTLYFAFSFIYVFRKNLLRKRRIEETDAQIVKEEASLTVLDTKIAKLKDIKITVLQLMKNLK